MVSIVSKVVVDSLVRVLGYSIYLRMLMPAMLTSAIENSAKVQGWFEVPIPIVNLASGEMAKIVEIAISFVDHSPG